MLCDIHWNWYIGTVPVSDSNGAADETAIAVVSDPARLAPLGFKRVSM